MARGYRIQRWTAVCPCCGYRESKKTHIYGQLPRLPYTEKHVCEECREIERGERDDYSPLHKAYLVAMRDEAHDEVTGFD